MATVNWINENGKETKKHIQGSGNTLCGIEIPQRHEWSVYGEPECKRCIKAQEKRNKS